MSAVDSVGLKQVTASTFSWTVQLSTDILDLDITFGPPALYAWKVATFGLFAHQNGTRSPGTRFEVKLDTYCGMVRSPGAV